VSGLFVAEPRPLRDYQSKAIDRLRASLRSGHRRPMLQAPTGAGKTVVASAIVRSAQEKGNRTVFCVPSLSLIDQTLESFWKDGIADIGVIQARHEQTDWSRPVQIASVQTLMRRPYPEAQLVIVDEAHRWFDHYGKWMQDPAWQRVPFVGLSATPWTKGLGKHYDDLIVVATTQQMIDEGTLSDFRVFAPSHPDLSGIKIVAGDYHEGQLSEVMSKAPLVADIVQTWLLRGEGRPTLCFAVDRAHAKQLAERFNEAGVSCGYQDMATKDDERADIKRKFHNGEYKVVCNVGTLTTGVDWDVRCIILARPTKSDLLYVQIIGRGLRIAEGKDHCIILDHSDTTQRLGFVTDIHHDELHSGKERGKAEAKKPPLPKECPNCTFLMPPRTLICPACGHVRKPPVAEEAKNGELAEIKRVKGTRPVDGKMIDIGGVKLLLGDFFGMLKRIGIERGYAQGWASNKYRDATGTWPNYYRDVRPLEPTMEVRSWVKAGMIRWAKGRAREGMKV
jgi:DNA repair protein RadD